jgi:hypothetical protein
LGKPVSAKNGPARAPPFQRSKAQSFDGRSGSTHCVQLFNGGVIQFQPGRLDRVGQVLVAGRAGNGSGHGGLHHQPRQRHPRRSRLVLPGNLVQRVEYAPPPVIQILVYGPPRAFPSCIPLRAVLGGEKARRQRVVGNYAKSMFLTTGSRSASNCSRATRLYRGWSEM